MGKLQFLRTNGARIVNEDGRPVTLRGVALGGWLMMEGYMMCGRNIPEKTFKENLKNSFGAEALEDFTRSFRDNFIREYDIEMIKDWGATCVRLPFNYRLIEYEDRPYSFNEEGLSYLDRAVEWCEENEIYCILDMHAAPGAQNPDWHSDCAGEPRFFSDPVNQDRYYRLWHFLADRYKHSSTVAGYDVLNEPVVRSGQERLVKEIYQRVTKEIRDADKKHIIFLEGIDWGVDIRFLGRPKDSNTAYSIHVYTPTEFTFNWEPDLSYPGKVYNVKWNKEMFALLAKPYRWYAEKNAAPVYVGEFGVNWRGGAFGEVQWTRDMLSVFEKNDFHWTYWTYKTMATSVFPDGIFRYLKNPSWINRKGPVTGWENFYTVWQKERARIINSWRTEKFHVNSRLLSALKNYF